MKRDMKFALNVKQSSTSSTAHTKIIASGTALTEEECFKLSEIMLENTNINSVDFSNSSLSRESLRILSLGMLGNDDISSINIADNRNSIRSGPWYKDSDSINETFSTFLKAVEKNPITSLNLKNTNIKNELSELAKVLAKKHIKFLDLSENNYREGTTNHNTNVHIPMELILSNTSLVDLNLSSIGLRCSEDAASLARGLRSHPSIVRLELKGNHIGTTSVRVGYNTTYKLSEGFAELVGSIAPIKTLKYLGLSDVSINVNSFYKILKSLEQANNKTLSFIDLSSNPLWSNKEHNRKSESDIIKNMELLCDLLNWQSKSLYSLDISNTFSMSFNRGTAIKFFADALGEKHNLKKLNLSFNCLSDKDIVCLIKILKQGSSLKELDLSSNFSFTEVTAIMLEQVLNTQTTLLLSNYQAATKAFEGKGNVAELLALEKLWIKFKVPSSIGLYIEKFLGPYCDQSSKFIVPGKQQNTEDNKSSDSSDDLKCKAILGEIFSGIAYEAVLEYLGNDFTSEISLVEIVEENSDLLIHA